MNCFRKFPIHTSDIVLPDKFTFPFNYTPHSLSVMAAEFLQKEIEKRIQSIHSFDRIGKMFGVLVVTNPSNEIGYLAAFSGKLGDKNHYDGFVPPLFDMLEVDGFYKQEEELINFENRKIEAIINDKQYIEVQRLRIESIAHADIELQSIKQRNKEKKKLRDAFKQSRLLTEEERESLNKESAAQHYELKDRTRHWKGVITAYEQEIARFEQRIDEIKQKRKRMSSQLQHQLFDQYYFLNAHQQKKSLSQIFPIAEGQLPPSGAGECAAPKLLNYAYLHDLKPIAMAEFWWGKSPSSEIRKHGHYYPSCKTKCEPILGHMLQGLSVEDNPLLNNPNREVKLETVWEDEYLVIIHKPEGFLSVNGKSIDDSVYSRMKRQYPNSSGPLTVHRLDMSTSGLMLIAKTKDIHRLIQIQFENRTIQKRYVAILDGNIPEDEGMISLPLRVDFDHRPRHLVCFEHGKPSVTKWKVVERKNNQTRVHFFPITGRTHQLRIHASHDLGLSTPILGDDLYGKRADRLYLHAEELTFVHPISGQKITVEAKAPF